MYCLIDYHSYVSHYNPRIDNNEYCCLLCCCVLNTFFLCHNSKIHLVRLHHSHVSANAPASKACSIVASWCADNHSFLSWLSVFFVIAFKIITQFTRVIKSVRFKTLFFNTFCAHICCAVNTRPMFTSSPRPFTTFSWSFHLYYVLILFQVFSLTFQEVIFQYQHPLSGNVLRRILLFF